MTPKWSACLRLRLPVFTPAGERRAPQGARLSAPGRRKAMLQDIPVPFVVATGTVALATGASNCTIVVRDGSSEQNLSHHRGQEPSVRQKTVA